MNEIPEEDSSSLMKRQPTPQHITWFLDLYRGGQLDLDPPYQRKSVWTPKDRRFFLDTIFRNYPAPPVFVHRTVDDNGFSTYHVVDGKQRLETIIAFAEGKISIDESYGDVNLNGKKFPQLETDYKKKFWDYVLVVDFIESIQGTNIEEVFDRVNRSSKNLLPQELRHARFDGWFINLVEDEGETSNLWWDLKVTTKAKEKRMRNVQFISELFLVTLENEIVGFSHDYIDKMYAKYDSPEEENPDFDQESFLEKKDWLKEIIEKIYKSNLELSSVRSVSANLYTLWALLSLNEATLKEVDFDSFNKKYAEFMKKVTEYEKVDDISTLSVTNENAFSYAQNLKGAATELPQRKARLNALSSIL